MKKLFYSLLLTVLALGSMGCPRGGNPNKALPDNVDYDVPEVTRVRRSSIVPYSGATAL